MTGYAMPRIGDVIAAKYRLDKVAGEGGMGVVYAAEHLVLKQEVAVKVLLPTAAVSEAMVERFAREARAAAKIDSEHVARVLDAGSLPNGGPFLVMEYLDGCDLEELLKLQKSLPVADVATYLVQALEGLAHAHAANIIHRDLKPANLFLACRPDGSNVIKLLDFGISKAAKSDPDDKRLTGHHVLGSPVYMSPEQLRNAGKLDARADLWSIGVVAYELLAGLPPFDGEGVGEIFANILEREPLPLHRRSSAIPEAFSDVIMKCLRREPEERWQSAGELARALLPFTDPSLAKAVERAEQVLARAQMMKVPATPLEARRVVDAIDAAKLRAMSPSAPAIPLARLKSDGTETIAESPSSRFAALVQSPMRRVSLALAAMTLVGGVAWGATRIRASAASAEAPITAQVDLPPPKAPEPAPTAADPPPPPASAAPSITPSAASAAPRAADAKTRAKPLPGKPPQRPKFLTTRE